MQTTKSTDFNAIIGHQYFQGHKCSLPASKLSNLSIEYSRCRRTLFDLITVQTNDARARNLYKSYASFCTEKYRHFMYYPLTLHPFSQIRMWLEILYILAIFVNYAALAIHYSEGHKTLDIHVIILHITDVILLIDILSNFFTGYVEGYTNQHVVLDICKISWHYVKTWFILDFISSLSYINCLQNTKNVRREVLLSALKLLKLPTLFRYLQNINNALRIGVFVQTGMEIFIFIYIYFLWSVFIQFALEYVATDSYLPANPRNCSWITKAKLWDAPTIDRFSYSFYRAVGMLRKKSNLNFIQYGCNLEPFYMLSWIIAKLLVLHCGLKYFVAVYGLESAACKYYKIKRQVEMYMNQRKFPPRIKEKILKFYAIRYHTTFFVEERILPCVSGQLREDIIMHTGRQLVRELVFMKTLPRTLLLQISFQLKLVIFTAGDIIFKINTIGDCMYFINKGTVAVYSESGKEIWHLEDGDFFGVLQLVAKRRFRTTSAVAVSNCELFMLSRDDFNSSITCYPTVYEHIKEVAIRRHERRCVVDERHKTEIKNFDE